MISEPIKTGSFFSKLNLFLIIKKITYEYIERLLEEAIASSIYSY